MKIRILLAATLLPLVPTTAAGQCPNPPLGSYAPGSSSATFGKSVATTPSIVAFGDPDAPGGGSVSFQTNEQILLSGIPSIQGHDTMDGDQFGFALDGGSGVSADMIAVGAPYHDTFQSNAGSVYLFRKTGPTTVEQIAKFENAGTDNFFGWSVSLDGDLIAIGTPGHGYAKQGTVSVYRLQGSGAWAYVGTMSAPTHAFDDGLGTSVSVDAARNRIVAGATATLSTSPKVVVFQLNGSQWSSTEVFAPGPWSGFAHSVSIAGDRLVVGASIDSSHTFQGGVVHAYEFNYLTGLWHYEAELKPQDPQLFQRFGASLELVDDRLLVGAPNEQVDGHAGAGAAYLFRREGGAWVQTARYESPDPTEFGAFGVDVEGALVGAPRDSGSGRGYSLPIASVFEAGQGTPAPNGVVPTMGFDTTPRMGAHVTLSLANPVAGANVGIIVAGRPQTQPNFLGLGGTLYASLDLIVPVALNPFAGSLSFTMPSKCKQEGTRLMFQGLIYDPTSSNPWVFSKAYAVDQGN